MKTFFSLLVLSLLLALTISGTVATVINKNTGRATEKSMFAFQVADGVSEAFLKRIYKDSDATIDDMVTQMKFYIDDDTLSCTDGVVSGDIAAGYGAFTVTFLKNDNSAIACSDPGWRDELVHIISKGGFAGTTRAIDIGIKPKP
mgnify:CR=1 FL=1